MRYLTKISDTAGNKIFKVLDVLQNDLKLLPMNFSIIDNDAKLTYYDYEYSSVVIYAIEIQHRVYKCIGNKRVGNKRITKKDIDNVVHIDHNHINMIKYFDLYMINLYNKHKKESIKVESPPDDRVNYKTKAIYIPYKMDNKIAYKTFTRFYNNFFSQIKDVLTFTNEKCNKIFLPIPKGYPYFVESRYGTKVLYYNDHIEKATANQDMNQFMASKNDIYKDILIGCEPSFNYEDMVLWIDNDIL